MKPTERRRITVTGIVQGVGFRPFVFREASQHGLSGLVANTSQGVEIEAQGERGDLDRFLTALRDQAPAQSLIVELVSETIPPRVESGFTIVHSASTGPASTLIAPDLAVCDECLAELFTPLDRRYRYPFINCTQCGPRFTIIRGIPYDRPVTAMAPFTMCPACQAEYDNPHDRRFHAQPNACPGCGPQAVLCDHHGHPLSGDPFTTMAKLLASGQIVAIKGLGGFHLAVDAANDPAVRRLRERKGRAEKPFAVMAADLNQARTLCELTEHAASILSSPQRPILLTPKCTPCPLSPAVAPGVNDLGLMLPYTPLHYLILRSYPHPLVMTSANLSEEPIAIDNQEAMTRLRHIADAFLVHDRAIVCRADDSVVRLTGDRPRWLRRGRGQTPIPIVVEGSGPQVLAVGGELKGVVCLLKGHYAFLSQHLGDLRNLSAFTFFKEATRHLLTLFAGEPQLVVHDLHPDYLTSRWASEESGLPLLAVQHHHAHLAACLAENHHPGPAIGVILDGTGYGTDGTVWGGEILIGGFSGFSRYAALEPMPLPGGEVAIHEPWRTAVGYLVQAFGQEIPDLPFLADHDWRPVAEITSRGVHAPLTTSCGRLFDAVAAMAGGCQRAAYEGQAAIELMDAGAGLGLSPYAIEVRKTAGGREMMITPLIRQLVADLLAGTPLAAISRTFHRTLIELLALTVRHAAVDSGLDTVVLSGGVFANHLLLAGLDETLTKTGLTVLSHSLTPCGDGSIALGQAMIGRQTLSNPR